MCSYFVRERSRGHVCGKDRIPIARGLAGKIMLICMGKIELIGGAMAVVSRLVVWAYCDIGDWCLRDRWCCHSNEG